VGFVPRRGRYPARAGIGRWSGDIVEFGCGYGTFTISAARRMAGTVYALDTDPLMVAPPSGALARLGLKKRRGRANGDCVAAGCGREPQSAGSALLFNFLHIADPVALLREARRVLRRGGLVGVIHWNCDARTRPEQCRSWGEAAGLRWVRDAGLPLGSPWQWGMVLERP